MPWSLFLETSSHGVHPTLHDPGEKELPLDANRRRRAGLADGLCNTLTSSASQSSEVIWLILQ